MRKIILPLAAAALLLVGCASTPEPPPEAATVPPAATVLPTATEIAPAISPIAEPVGEVSDRGNLIKSIGQNFGLLNEDGSTAADMYVTGITVDPVCTGDYTMPSENGHLVKVDMQIQTYPGLGYPVYPSAGSWKAVADNGTTFNGSLASGAAFSCLSNAELIAGEIGPGESVVGSVILDVPSPTGVLIYQDSPGIAWEWVY